MGESSLDWAIMEEVGGEYRQTFYRREPLASAPRVMGTLVDSRLRALLDPPAGLARWPDALRRMLYVGGYARATISGGIEYGDELVSFDVATREWAVLDDLPAIRDAVLDGGRAVVLWEQYQLSGFHLHDLDSFNDRAMQVYLRDVIAMTATHNAVVWAERRFAGEVGPIYRATEGGVTILADLGTQVYDLFTDGDDVWAVTEDERDRYLVRIGPDAEVTWYRFPSGPRIVDHRSGTLILFDGDTSELRRQPLPR